MPQAQPNSRSANGVSGNAKGANAQRQAVVATERAYWLAWSQIDGVGPVTQKRLWEQFGSLAKAWAAPADTLLTVDGIGLLNAEKIVVTRPKLKPAALLEQHEAANQSFWTPADADYPALLFAINDPPPVLYYRGKLRLNELPNMTVGIVGTRRPSAYGKRWTQRLSRQLTVNDTVIVSGLAAGIDTEAHTSCLAQQGLTVAVLGTGVDVVYPKRNQGLYGQIVDSGLVVSEYPDGTSPDKAHFPRRNRIIAGLSRATLVTEAPARSGALITARLANDYCREVYALPASLDNAQGVGCLNLVNQGAQLILGEQMLVDALAAMPGIERCWPGQPRANPATANQASASPAPANQTAAHQTELRQTPTLAGVTPQNVPLPPERMTAGGADPLSASEHSGGAVESPELSPSLAQVLKAVSLEPLVLDQIVRCAQIDTGQVLAALVQLELMGLVTQLPGLQYQRA